MRIVPVVIALLSGCTETLPSESRELCTQRVIGDVTLPVEVSIMTRDASGRMRDVGEHAPRAVTLSDARSGLAVSVRARNLDGCAVAIVVRGLDRDELRGGTMLQLSTSGQVDPSDALQFVELAAADGNDAFEVVIQDSMRRIGSATYEP